MAFNPQEISDFAHFYGFHYDSLDPVSLMRDVLNHMERGLKGQSSSLPMIPSYISPVSHVPPGKTVLALDAGGTNLRASLVRFDEKGKAAAQETQKVPMPGTQGHLSAEQFFDQIAVVTAPLLEKAGSAVGGIGFTFSYPMAITEDADGIPMAFSKELDIPEVTGKPVGKGLRNALARRGLKFSGPIVMLNDTVATLLSGVVEIPADGEEEKTFDKYGIPGGPVIGLILGTGFNTAYPEKSIPKIGFESSVPQIVVCETGTFAISCQGILDREYDATTKNPGAYTLEKASSGAYLGPLTLHILKQAVKDGVLKFKRSAELLDMQTLQTRDLNYFQHHPLAAEGPLGGIIGLDETDALGTILYIAQLITERGGMLSAAVAAAGVERVRFGYEGYAPVRIAVEGTTYMIYKGMRKAFESWLHVMLFKGKPRSYVVAPVEQASLFGAAVAALSR
ncbi:MAG: hexokinase [Spirochaetaceae bacterium]|jgi:hexokinase|nr:hexokinase [Spirochaetaceae bacterium]